jgi:pyruvate formate lyase activating enzyme
MEYALDVAEVAHKAHIFNVFVTNGFMTQEALDAIAPFLDAANVDLKAFSDEFYKEQCGARLKPVLETLQRMKERNVWVEVTTLLIPGLNDSTPELEELAGFIKSLGPETPWHISRFHPTYRMMDRPSTPIEKLRQAREIGFKMGLNYVYTGNVPGDEGENTFCRQCKTLLFKRFGFKVKKLGVLNGRCSNCGVRIDGVGLG